MIRWRIFLAAVAGALASACSGSAPPSAPAQIIFLRHGEKPDTGSTLNERGRERARALVQLFTHDARVLEHGPAVAIYAMRPHGKNGSVRAIETMEPTARALGLELNSTLTRDELAPLVRALTTTPAYAGKTVVVCWEHDAIPEMLRAFGWRDGPRDWPGKAYDRLWILDFDHGKPTRFRDLPQNLLPGDKAN